MGQASHGPHSPYQRRARFWLSLLATLVQLGLLAATGRWLLPALGVRVPWLALVIIGAAIVAFDLFTYVMGTRALEKPPVVPVELVGRTAVVVLPLTPVGMVRLNGELWQARAVEGSIESGPVEVVAQEGLKLKVRRRAGP